MLPEVTASTAEREDLLHLALGAARMGLWIWNLADDTVTWTSGCFEIFGIVDEGQALTADCFFGHVHPDDVERVNALVAQCLQRRSTFDAELRIVRGDGQVRWISDQGQLVLDPAGEPVRMLGAMRDITEDRRAADAQREHAERLQALWEAEERLGLAVETTDTGLWTWDMATGAVTWTAQCYRIHGLAPGEFDGSGRHFFQLVHPDDRQRVESAVGAAVREHRLYECEFRILRPGGEVAWVVNRARARYGEDGTPLSVLGTIQDISERKASEQRLQVALEASRTGTFRWDIRTDALWWDVALDRLFGLPPGEAVRSLERFVSMVHPDDRAEVIERCARCRDHAEDFEMEFRVVHPDGSVRWLYDRGRTFTDPQGRARYMTGACVDTTERKVARDALRHSEAFYRRTLESVPGMTFSTSEAGECDYLSAQWRSYTGVQVREHFGRAWIEALHPDDRDRAGAAWDRAIRTRTPYEVDYRMRRHDGVYRWLKARGRIIPGMEGLPGRWIGTVVDVNDLQEAQAALQARERELRTVTDNSPDLIARFDRSLRHVFISAAIERITGRPVAEFLGRTNRELGMPEALRERWDAALDKVFRERRPIGLQFEFDRDGERSHFSSRLVPEFGDNGEVEHVLAVTRDVSDAWHAQEALRRADRQKDDFLATLAHELRNPLAPLRTGLGVLQRGTGDGEAQRVRDIMERQLDHMVRLVDELLDIARISQGKVVLRREVLPLRAVLEHALDGSRPLIEAQAHQLVWDGVDPGLHVHGDVTRLSQVVGNLLNNAAKYTPPGGRITLRAAAEGSELCISVEDTGVGIPRDLLDRVFERFVQAAQHLERAQGGLGIGLSVVRSLVEMHGGRVLAESPGPGLGSRF